MASKRKQYSDLNAQFFNLRNGHDGAETFKQIQKDLLRMPMLQNRQDVFDVSKLLFYFSSTTRPS